MGSTRRILIITALLMVIGSSHWITPTDPIGLHAIHIILRKLFVVPIVLAAIWFTLRGAIITTSVASAIYLPHIFLQWSGQTVENLNQIGEVASLWIIAVLAGFLIGREKNILHDLARSNQGALLALIGTMDARRLKRKNHALRVHAYAERIARELNLAIPGREVLAQAAVLHDLGMIAVPDNILHSPEQLGELDPNIRKHPAIGYNILRRVPAMREVAEIVYTHHERYDGTGYPRGLSGQQIPLETRIFAIADVFDALTIDRPYRKALTFAKAREVIQSERGMDFDPEVVDAFLRVPEAEWLDIIKRLEAREETQERSDEPVDD